MMYEGLFNELEEAGFVQWVEQLRQQEADWLVHHGDYTA